jgi:hypothetical protein
MPGAASRLGQDQDALGKSSFASGAARTFPPVTLRETTGDHQVDDENDHLNSMTIRLPIHGGPVTRAPMSRSIGGSTLEHERLTIRTPVIGCPTMRAANPRVNRDIRQFRQAILPGWQHLTSISIDIRHPTSTSDIAIRLPVRASIHDPPRTARCAANKAR